MNLPHAAAMRRYCIPDTLNKSNSRFSQDRLQDLQYIIQSDNLNVIYLFLTWNFPLGVSDRCWLRVRHSLLKVRLQTLYWNSFLGEHFSPEV